MRAARRQPALVAGARLGFGHGLALGGSVSQVVAQNLDGAATCDSVLPRVRSDYARYADDGRDLALPTLYAERIWSPAPDIFARVTAGYLEPMFAGVSGELLWRPHDRPFAIGLDVAHVAQRDFDQRFGVQGYPVTTGHVSLHADLPVWNLTATLRGGRYLAGDWGGTLEVARRFDSGIEVGAFATLTEVPFDRFGEGSFDKGIFIRVPLDLFGARAVLGRRGDPPDAARWRAAARGGQSVVGGDARWAGGGAGARRRLVHAVEARPSEAAGRRLPAAGPRDHPAPRRHAPLPRCGRRARARSRSTARPAPRPCRGRARDGG